MGKVHMDEIMKRRVERNERVYGNERTQRSERVHSKERHKSTSSYSSRSSRMVQSVSSRSVTSSRDSRNKETRESIAKYRNKAHKYKRKFKKCEQKCFALEKDVDRVWRRRRDDNRRDEEEISRLKHCMFRMETELDSVKQSRDWNNFRSSVRRSMVNELEKVRAENVELKREITLLHVLSGIQTHTPLPLFFDKNVPPPRFHDTAPLIGAPVHVSAHMFPHLFRRPSTTEPAQPAQPAQSAQRYQPDAHAPTGITSPQFHVNAPRRFPALYGTEAAEKMNYSVSSNLPRPITTTGITEEKIILPIVKIEEQVAEEKEFPDAVSSIEKHDSNNNNNHHGVVRRKVKLADFHPIQQVIVKEEIAESEEMEERMDSGERGGKRHEVIQTQPEDLPVSAEPVTTSKECREINDVVQKEEEQEDDDEWDICLG